MHRLKLAFILPALFCGVEGLLRYWAVHSVASIPNVVGWDTAANFLSEGLNFPALIATGLILTPLGYHMPARPSIMLLVLLSEAGMWYFIGNWFDHRVRVNGPPGQKGLFPSVVLSALVLVYGIFSLVYSFARAHSLHISNFIQTIAIALLQTWAVFLIGIPAVGIVRYFLEKRRKKDLSDSASRPHVHIGNFRLFEMIVAVFVVLLLLWYPHGPLFPK